MEEVDLKAAIEISNDIKKVKGEITNTINQKCEWIVFTFGNGSCRETVCSDEETIKDVREFILLRNKAKLAKLENKLKSI